MAAIWKILLTFLLDYFLPKLIAWVREVTDKMKRTKKQEETLKKVEEDINEKKPRDEETRKNEEDHLNS